LNTAKQSNPHRSIVSKENGPENWFFYCNRLRIISIAIAIAIVQAQQYHITIDSKHVVVNIRKRGNDDNGRHATKL
jgi:hypothetical protein